MKRDCAALPLVAYLDLESEKIGELALERLDVRIGSLGRVSSTCARDPGACAGLELLTARLLLRLADRKAFADHIAGERFWIGSGRYSPRVAHADIALQ